MTDDEKREAEELADMIIRNYTASMVADGTVTITGKSYEEIVLEARRKFYELLKDDEVEISMVIDHSDNLLTMAKKAKEEKNLNLAILMQATWFEHWTNMMLDNAIRRLGMSDTTYLALARELRLRTKLTAAWELLDLPVIDADCLAAIDECTKQRNNFAHYKWKSGPDNDDELLSRSYDRSTIAIDWLRKLEDEVLYGGLRKQFYAHRDRDNTKQVKPK